MGLFSAGKSLIPLFLALAPLLGRAQVREILSSHELSVEAHGICSKGSVLAIYSRENAEEPLGFAELNGEQSGGACIATVLSHSRSALIRAGDPTMPLDLKGRNPGLPGRYDLMSDEREDVAVRYKPLVYAGYLFGHTAATLQKGEFLVGPVPLMYGITDRLQVDTAPILAALAQTGQLGLKYQFFRDEDMRLSLHMTGLRFFKIGKGSAWTELQYDSHSNGRSMSHTKLRYTFKLPDSLPLENKGKEKQGSAEISSVYEWVLPSWHRILLGPKFTAGEEKELGFVLTALFLYRTFHWSLNLEVNSLSEINFRENKQAFSFDLFWRF